MTMAAPATSHQRYEPLLPTGPILPPDKLSCDGDEMGSEFIQRHIARIAVEPTLGNGSGPACSRAPCALFFLGRKILKHFRDHCVDVRLLLFRRGLGSDRSRGSRPPD